MNLPLQTDVKVEPAVMDNLLYEATLADACRDEIEVQDVAVHWYGKRQPRPLRKMGHLTAISATVEQAAHLADVSLEQLKQQA